MLAAAPLPVPAAPFAVLEAAFNPTAQPIPTGLGLLRRQIRQDEPRILIPLIPAGQQGATHTSPFAGKTAHASTPLAAFVRHQAHDRLKRRAAFGSLGSRFTADIDPQKRMPVIL